MVRPKNESIKSELVHSKKTKETSSQKADNTLKRKREENEEEEEDNENEKGNNEEDNSASSDEKEGSSIEDKWVEKNQNKRKSSKTNLKSSETAGEKDEGDSEEEEEEDDVDVDVDGNKDTQDKKPRLSEQEIDKADSTVFVGNVPITTITSKPVYKKFQELFEPYGKVTSIRFRSIAFSKLLPRKAAFIKQQLHPTRKAANAYVVFETPEQARKSVSLNASVFEGHHLRVDRVSHPASQDNKRCVFVGNLDFDMDEEPLWQHFGSCGEIEHVRVVRDSKTNFGKGFCYVQFKDPVSVTKALLLNGKNINGEEKGRELRVVRSKNIREAQKQRKAFIKSKTNNNNSNKKVKLSLEEKTKLGRAKTAVGKAARAEISSVLEGTRAKKGDYIPGIKQGGKKKKPRIRERSTNYKNLRKEVQKANKASK